MVADGEGWGKGQLGSLGWTCIYTTMLKMSNQQGPTVESLEFCSMLYGCLNGRGIWGIMETCVCMAESLHCSPETIITLLIGYTPIQNKKCF